MTDRSPLQDRLVRAIGESGSTRDHFDAILRKKLGTTGKPLWDIERGKAKRPQPGTLRAIEDVLDLQPESLVDLVHPRERRAVAPAPAPDRQPTHTAEAGNAVPIIALDLSLSMGPGTLIEEFVEAETVMLDLALVQAITRTPSDRLRMVRGVGHSMEPTLRTDDRVLIDINEKAMTRVGGVYWIDYHGAHGIKRLRPAGKGRILVMSDNVVEPDFEVEANELRIEGRAIWFARGL